LRRIADGLEEHAVLSGLLQVPRPLALHLSGEPHAAVAQQAPSTQLPEVHWVGFVHTLPFAPVVTQAVTLAGQVAVSTGRGPDLLLALTGRQPLGFSVV